MFTTILNKLKDPTILKQIVVSALTGILMGLFPSEARTIFLLGTYTFLNFIFKSVYPAQIETLVAAENSPVAVFERVTLRNNAKETNFTEHGLELS